MPIAAPIQNSFNAGEFSPLAVGRTDYPKYKNGLSLMQRFIPIVQGGATRCPGFKYTKPTKANGQARLIPFIFNNGDAFNIEFGDQYVRFYYNRAPVTAASPLVITAISKANPGVVTYTGTDPANGTELYLSAIVGMTELNGRWVKVANVNGGANTFELTTLDGANINTTAYTTYSSAGTAAAVYEVASPFLVADIEDLRVISNGDVLYIVHPDYAPRKLSRTAINAWSFSTVAFLDGPYLPINATTTTLTPAATTGTNILITASAVTGINGGLGFQSTDVGRLVRIKHATTWGYAIIKTYNSTVTVHADIVNAFGATTASATWRTGEWSDTTGYPSVLFSFEDRLGFAASPVAPQTANLSFTGDYENMAPTATDSTVTASHALQLKLNAGQQDPIRWVVDDEKGLLLGTKGAEWLVRSSNTGDAMSAINFPSARRSTKHGSAFIEPLEVGKALLFAQTSKRKLRELAYVYEVDGFRAPDMTVLAEHITKTGIKRMAYQQEPYNLVWVVRVDGTLVAMTYDREQDVIGWHRHPMGGYSDSGKLIAPIVESVSVIPSPDGSQDDVWIIVKRYINGGTKRYVEYLQNFNSDFDSVEDCYFVDAGISGTMASGTVIRNLDHLEGETVQLLIDGSPRPDLVVSGGKVTLTTAGEVYAVGEGFLSRLQTLRPEAGSATGTAQGKVKRIHKLAALLHQTVGLRVGRDFDTMDTQQFRKASDPMSGPVPLFSGIKTLEFGSDYDLDGYVCLEVNQPLPCTLLALMPQLHTQDAQ